MTRVQPILEALQSRVALLLAHRFSLMCTEHQQQQRSLSSLAVDLIYGRDSCLVLCHPLAAGLSI